MVRRLGGDHRVAVPVAADPAPPAQERRHERWARPRPSRVAGWRVVQREPARASQRASPFRLGERIERPVECPVEARHDREQCLVEVGHRRPDLIERGRADGSQVGRSPQERDLLAQSTPHIRVLAPGEARIVEPLDQVMAAAQGDEERSPAGLGRVGGQDRRDGQVPNPFDDLGQAPARAPHPADRLGHGIVEDPAPRGSLPPSQRPDPVPLLGQVDQLEVQRKRADEGRRAAQVEPIEIGRQPRALGWVLRPAQGDRPAPDPLDELQELDPLLFHDDLTEQRAQQPDLARQRIACARRPDAARFAADGRVGSDGHGRRLRGMAGRAGVGCRDGAEAGPTDRARRRAEPGPDAPLRRV